MPFIDALTIILALAVAPWQLDQIAPGDRVAFTLQDMPYGLIVIEIKKR
ncbi:MAG TPA: hypothetical protein VLR90_23210 [Blastocatellia bacterium]|nr:hypothetical protein [Blastocatellia bacterium]